MRTLTHSAPASGGVTLIYDGECPACSAYSKGLRLRRAAGALLLVDARAEGPWRDEMDRLDLDLDQGFALVLGRNVFHGAEALTMLAMLSQRSDAFNAINAAVFRSPFLARALYPILRAGRDLLLLARGKPKLSEPAH